MQQLTGRERISRIIRHEGVDRIGLYEHFWGDTQKKWIREGHLKEGESVDDHFNFDISECWACGYIADPEFKNVVVEEDDETILVRDGNGALLRRHKCHNSTPEHVDFMVKDRTLWDEKIKAMLTPARNRINFDAYRKAREKANAANRFFVHSGINVFEAMHPLCGHEHMLMGMALDPDWIKDMADTYSELMINLMEILFAEAGRPDGIWFYEDMGFKDRPFMSPEMYRELILPGHKKTVAYAHSLGLPVIMHSCGYVAPFIPGIIEAGVDCLQVIEVKAGMDLLKIKREFGDNLALFGGFDARNLVANDIDAIDKELHEKIPVVMEGSGYILHSDHSIPEQCEYGTYRHFVDEALRLGTYR